MQYVDCPASLSQQYRWERQSRTFSPHNNGASFLMGQGRVDTSALQRALNAAVSQHEALRTSFHLDHGNLRQQIHAESSVPLRVTDLRTIHPGEGDAKANDLLSADAAEAFDYTRLPLLRAQLVQLPLDRFYYGLVFDHLICDAWSIGLVMATVCELYEHFLNHREPAPHARAQFSAVVERERREIDHLANERLPLWHRLLDGRSRRLALPVQSQPQGAAMMYSKARVSGTAGTSTVIRRIAREEHVTPFTVILGIWALVLRAGTGQDEMVVATTYANRDQAEFFTVVGHLMDYLLVPLDLAGNLSFRDVLRRVWTTLREIYNNPLPFLIVSRELGIGLPHWDVEINFHPHHMTQVHALSGTRMGPHPVAIHPQWFDPGSGELFLVQSLMGRERTYAKFDYDSVKVHPDLVARLGAGFFAALDSVAGNREARVSQVAAQLDLASPPC